MSEDATTRFHARFRRVLDFIDSNLEAELDLEALSAVAAFSKFHFHRQFSELYGLSVFRYVQMTRLKRASYQLVFREAPVVDIALESGFTLPEAFARAFKKSTGQTPSAFRSDPRWDSWHAHFSQLEHLRSTHMQPTHCIEEVRVVDFPQTAVAALEFRGSKQQLGDAIATFIDWRRQNGLPPKVSATYNLVHDHPEDEDQPLHYELCAATTRPVLPNTSGMVGKVIPAGRCALLTHVGSEATLGQSAHFLYAQWLPQSGAEPRDFPLFFKRVKFFPEVPEHEAVTEIYLPIF